ncbi:hypothetical protein Y032_0027g1560 [Ancylostoma ceylanicum]|uniref:Uncharacterized protein n=1 Tax=Ancylostoma ceylanicum TaxID=53326 RepID=A0A016UVN2_9BILA|nr:hypothetical protein Y032_0027g1560 [Ancylostoma ceylanicum]
MTVEQPCQYVDDCGGIVKCWINASTAILSRKKRHTSYVQVLQLEKLSQCFVFERAALEHVGERDART